MYNVGDIVRVRNFDDIANDPRNIGSHAIPAFRGISFPQIMRELCGEILEVVQSGNRSGEYRLLKEESKRVPLRWIFVDEFLEPVSVDEFLEPVKIKELAGFSDDEIQVLLGGDSV